MMNPYTKQVGRPRREYNQFVATDTIEDYALRYVPLSFRKWSELLIANTAIGGISFLALEAIGASIAISYGFSNAVWAILIVGVIIFLTNLPIAYHAAKFNLDIDLLTRGAGFGYIGSTITSLIYASFTFIFFALEAAIMAQALQLYFHLPVAIGYILCSLLIIPLVFYGITLINKLQLWTQPLWLILMVMPYAFIYHKAPETFTHWFSFAGKSPSGASFDPLLFGAASTVSFSLIVQIGEQVDYLRFMPEQMTHNRGKRWIATLIAGPGWIVLGILKQLGGAFLAFLAISEGIDIAVSNQPMQMYLNGYHYVFSDPGVALAVTTLFVVVSQIKINVTNAYAGSLAWSNFFSRLTHNHPGRVVWLIFNIIIALILMELDVFTALEKVLGLYANVAVAWIGALAADLAINKPLGLSPRHLEFRRSHLHNINPVGTGAMLLASIVSIVAYLGVFGPIPQAFAPFIALGLSVLLVPVIALLTKSRFYLAIRSVTAFPMGSTCTICEGDYDYLDCTHCPVYAGTICSLCCSLDNRCQDACKPAAIAHHPVARWLDRLIKSVWYRFLYLFLFFAILVGSVFGMAYYQQAILTPSPIDAISLAHLQQTFLGIYSAILVLLGIGTWWLVLVEQNHKMAQNDLDDQNRRLQEEVVQRQAAEHVLREKEERLSLATKYNGVGVWDYNPQTRSLTWDDSMLALYGTLRENFSGVYDAWKMALLPEDRERAEKELQTAISGGVPFDSEFRIRWPNEEIRHIKAVAKVFYDDHGNPLRMLGTNVDITDLKRAKAKLQLSASVFTHAREGITITDASANIIDVNDAFIRITGYSRDEVVGKNSRIFKSDRQSPEFYVAMWKELTEKGYWSSEIWSQRKNGEVYPQMLTISAM